jgi:rod shape-determining protein MreC
MENFFSRYKNPLVLMAVLFLQVIALATQVTRPDSGKVSGSGGTRLIRVWTVTAIAPVERALVGTGHFFRNSWHDYVDLHDVRRQNRELQDELARLRLEQVRLRGDADEVRRLRALLEFKERYVGQTVAAQVIGTSGTELLRTITIDRGSRHGIRSDMAVITPDGIVGKVKEVFPFSAQVLLINDQYSGAGVILENSRLHGVLYGSPQGFLHVGDIMSDEKIDVGEPVITSGGDKIYPKGLPVGTVTYVAPPDPDSLSPFLSVRIKPAAHLDRLEEVLIVTKITEEGPIAGDDAAPRRAADILSQRLPSIQKPADPAANKTAADAAANAASGANRSATPASPSASPAAAKKKIANEDTAAGATSPGAARSASANNASSSPSATGPKKKIGSDATAAGATSPSATGPKKKAAPEDSAQNATSANAAKAKPKAKATPTPTPAPSPSPDEAAPTPPKASGKANEKPPTAAERPPR